ncbi:hypothetical protein [Caenimonas aquaedulcis]|uniref:Uncharacterized protein n=1 Tax=Caenimonas aquaedulcis TaxID=2793270 RepID=A0A931MHV3_9BURK|nr:hypothetical protein [Caenimonas aquaedulcis]MBG9389327.1 hypothetical protein [Caenimonas aquaedulcis]
MPRELKSAEEIQAEVRRLLHETEAVRHDKAEIGVPAVTALAELDATGCNWSMMYFRNARGYSNECAWAIMQVQTKCNLRDD